MLILFLVGVILVIKVVKDDKFKGLSCLVRFLLIFIKKLLKYLVFFKLWVIIFLL